MVLVQSHKNIRVWVYTVFKLTMLWGKAVQSCPNLPCFWPKSNDPVQIHSENAHGLPLPSLLSCASTTLVRERAAHALSSMQRARGGTSIVMEPSVQRGSTGILQWNKFLAPLQNTFPPPPPLHAHTSVQKRSAPSQNASNSPLHIRMSIQKRSWHFPPSSGLPSHADGDQAYG